MKKYQDHGLTVCELMPGGPPSRRYIPRDANNRRYRKYLEWEAEGNTPDPKPPPTPSTDPNRVELAAAIEELANASTPIETTEAHTRCINALAVFHL